MSGKPEDVPECPQTPQVDATKLEIWAKVILEGTLGIKEMTDGRQKNNFRSRDHSYYRNARSQYQSSMHVTVLRDGLPFI